ncbi:MAG: ZIP family metal transporter [Patescibacteria group bacterium]|nr:ZIP family metal transporter [Patescibacteria group bacterium]
MSTFLGGLFGLKYKDKMHLILGLTAGIILGVISFDIFPEIIKLTGTLGVNSTYPMIALVVGFMVFHVAEKLLLVHHGHEDNYGPHTHPTIGKFQALALAGHSFLDGVGIGLGFQISSTIGIFIALAVIAHDFADGLNTVSLMLRHKNTDKKALQFLFVDAFAPVVGGFSTFFFTLSEKTLLMYLGFFAGFLLYIGVSDILPEAHSKNSSMKTVAMTTLGIIFIFIITRFI